MVATTKPDLTRIWASGAPGSNVIDPDVTTPGKVAAGWLAEVPPFEHFNFLQQWFTQGLAHNNEQGINVWDTNTDYPIGGLAKGSDAEIYRALIAQNGNDPVGDATNWKLLINGITPYTVAEAQADPSLKEGTILQLSDRGNAQFKVIAPTSNNGFDIIDGTASSKSIQLVLDRTAYAIAFGAKFDYTSGATSGATDDSLALLRCHQYASDNGINIEYPYKKIAVVSPTIETFDESTGNTGTDVKVVFDILTNQFIDFNESTVKMADDISSSGTPVRMRMFFSNTPKQDVLHIRGHIDMNGQNNEINGNQWTQFHFGFSGTIGGIAARGDAIILEGMRYKNTAGVTCIAGQQSNTPGVTLGGNWRIGDCEFRDNGLDSPDHSSIFAYFTDSFIVNNVFDNANPFNDALQVGGLVACELHGSDLLFAGNEVKNYYQGVWVSSNETEAKTRGIKLLGNSFNVSQTSVDFYSRNIGSAGATVNEGFIYDTVVAHNFIHITDDVTGDALKGVFSCKASRGVRGVKIHDNICTSDNVTNDTVMFRITIAANAYEPHDQIELYNNTCDGGLVAGVVVFWNSISVLPRMTISNNDFGFYTSGTLASKDLHLQGSSGGSISTLTCDFRNTSITNIQTDGTVFTGTHDGAGNAATLSDSGAAFTSLVIGRTVFNTTDGSSGVVTAFTATTLTATLTGGTDDDWDASDTYTLETGARCSARGKAHLDLTVVYNNVIEGNGTKTDRVYMDSDAGVVNITTSFTLGSTSSVTGNVSISLKNSAGLNAISASIGSIANAIVNRAAANHPAIGNADATGDTFSLFDVTGQINASNPITFTTADVIKLTGQFYANSVSI